MGALLLVVLVGLGGLFAITARRLLRRGPTLEASLEDQVVAMGFVPDGAGWRRGELTIDARMQLTGPLTQDLARDDSLAVRPLEALSMAEPGQLVWMTDEVLDAIDALRASGGCLERGQALVQLDAGAGDVVRALDVVTRATERPTDGPRLADLI